jgi:hypothetical protein
MASVPCGIVPIVTAFGHRTESKCIGKMVFLAAPPASLSGCGAEVIASPAALVTPAASATVARTRQYRRPVGRETHEPGSRATPEAPGSCRVVYEKVGGKAEADREQAELEAQGHHVMRVRFVSADNGRETDVA